MLSAMSRAGFGVLSLGVLLSLLLLVSAGTLAHPGGASGVALLLTPVLILCAGTAIGVVVMLRARAARLSGLWGFLAMILTVQTLALMVTILVDDDALGDPFRAVLGMPALWLLVSFIGFLLWVPNWAGPRALDIGLSVVAALAAIIVIAVGFTMHGASSDASLVERTIAGMVAAVPSADWIGVGVFVTALAGVMAGRLLPEAE
jgi:hypothetical protein